MRTDHRVAVREVSDWTERATRIPDVHLRAHALDALATCRDHIFGSALFSILAREHSKSLVRLLVAYQVLWNYLDATSEASQDESQDNGCALHRALAEAVDPGAALSDHYALHPWRDDGGYVLELITVCREGCVRLPHYEVLRPVILEAARLAQTQGANHVQDPGRREDLLKSLSADAFTGGHELTWYERTMAMSATLPQVFLALAAAESCGEEEIAATRAMYFGLMGVVVGMIDSYADEERDVALERHSYFGYYPSLLAGMKRMEELVTRLAAEARRLPRGERHSIMVSCAVAAHLTSPGAASVGRWPLTREMIRRSDDLTRLAVYAFCVWRLRQRWLAPAPPRVEFPSTGSSCAVSGRIGAETAV